MARRDAGWKSGASGSREQAMTSYAPGAELRSRGRPDRPGDSCEDCLELRRKAAAYRRAAFLSGKVDFERLADVIVSLAEAHCRVEATPPTG